MAKGVRSRRLTISLAIRRALGSSPYSFRTRAISASSDSLRKSAAVIPLVGSIRMSSATPSRNENPRASSSICREETPRSRRMPSKVAPASSAIASISS